MSPPEHGQRALIAAGLRPAPRLVEPDDDWQPPECEPEGPGPGDEILSDRTHVDPTRAAAGAPLFTPVAIDAVTIPRTPEWLIHNLLPTRGLAVIVGPPKSRKSFLTTDMLFAVARGVPYAGRKTRQGPVLYATGEGITGFKRRMVAMRRHYGVEGQNVPFYMIENVPDLGSATTDLPRFLAELDAFIAETGMERPAAIALDTLARCMGEADENSAKDMGRFVTRCGAIERHFKCLVPVVHHMGKDVNKGGRGSNALNGAADVTMTVEKSEAFSTVRIDEMKDGPEGQEWRFALETVDLSETSGDPSETSNETSTCVVRILSEPEQAKHKTKHAKPRGVDGDLLSVITRAIAEAGTTDIPGDIVARGTPAVAKTTLKSFCATMDWQQSSDNADSFRATLSRSLSKLRAADHIGFTKDWVWLR